MNATLLSLLKEAGIPCDDIECEVPSPKKRDVDFIRPDYFDHAHSFTCQNTVDRNGYPMQASFDQSLSCHMRRVHRYNRRARFLVTLCFLVNVCTGHDPIPPAVFEEITPLVKTRNPSRIFNQTRLALKKTGRQKYYARIPCIIKQIAPDVPSWQRNIDFYRILEKFDHLNHNFCTIPRSSRKYFPPMRYIALRILADCNIAPPYKIPSARTPSKKVSLDALYTTLCQPIHVNPFHASIIQKHAKWGRQTESVLPKLSSSPSSDS